MDVIKIYIEKIKTQSDTLHETTQQPNFTKEQIISCNHQIKFALEQIEKQIQKIQIQEPKLTTSCFNCEQTKTQMAIFKRQLIKQQTEMMTNIKLMQEQQKQMLHYKSSNDNIDMIEIGVQTDSLRITLAEQQEFNEILGLQKQIYILRKENEKLGYENDYLQEKVDVTNEIILQLHKQLHKVSIQDQKQDESKYLSANSQYNPELVKDMTKHAKQLEQMVLNHIQAYKQNIQFIQVQQQQISNYQKQCLEAKQKYIQIESKFDKLQSDNDDLNFAIRNIIENLLKILKIDKKTIQYYIENEVLEQADKQNESQQSEIDTDFQIANDDQDISQKRTLTENILYKPINEIQNKPATLQEYQKRFRQFIKEGQNNEFTKFKKVPPSEQKRLMLEVCIQFLTNDINTKMEELEYCHARQHVMEQQEQDYQELLQQFNIGNTNMQSTKQQNIELQLTVTQQTRELEKLQMEIENKNYEIQLLNKQLDRMTKQFYSQDQKPQNQLINLDEESNETDAIQASQSQPLTNNKKSKNKQKISMKKLPLKQKKPNKKKQAQSQMDDENSTELISLAKKGDTQITDAEFSELENRSQVASIFASQFDEPSVNGDNISLNQSQIINNAVDSQNVDNNSSSTSPVQQKKKNILTSFKKLKQQKQSKNSQPLTDSNKSQSEASKSKSSRVTSPPLPTDESEISKSISEATSKKTSKLNKATKEKKNKLLKNKNKKLSAISETELELSNEANELENSKDVLEDSKAAIEQQQSIPDSKEQSDMSKTGSQISQKDGKKEKKPKKEKKLSVKKLKELSQPPEPVQQVQDKNKELDTNKTSKIHSADPNPINQEKPPIQLNELNQKEENEQIDQKQSMGQQQCNDLDDLLDDLLDMPVKPSTQYQGIALTDPLIPQNQLHNSQQQNIKNDKNDDKILQSSNQNTNINNSSSIKSPESTQKSYSSKDKKQDSKDKQQLKEQQKQEKQQLKLEKQQKKQQTEYKKKNKQEEQQQDKQSITDNLFKLSTANELNDTNQAQGCPQSQVQSATDSYEVSDSKQSKKSLKKQPKEKKEPKNKKNKNEIQQPSLIPSSIFAKSNQEQQENKSSIDQLTEQLKNIDLSSKPTKINKKEKIKEDKQKKEEKKQDKKEKGKKKKENEIEFFDK